MKTFKYIFVFIALCILSGCTDVFSGEDVTTGISWWLTAIFFFLWLFLSCPMITQLFVGDQYTDGTQEDKELNRSLAGASVYAFPIMYVMSLILGVFCEWYINYLISIVVGFVVGAIIRASINPLCDKYIHKTKWLWIGQGILVILSVILALTI